MKRILLILVEKFTDFILGFIPTKSSKARRISEQNILNKSNKEIRSFTNKWNEQMNKKHLSNHIDEGSIYLVCLQNLYTNVVETSKDDYWKMHRRIRSQIEKGVQEDIDLLNESIYAMSIIQKHRLRNVIKKYESFLIAFKQFDKDSIERAGKEFIVSLNKFEECGR